MNPWAVSLGFAIGFIQVLVCFILNSIKEEIRGLRVDLQADVDALDEKFEDHLRDHAKGYFPTLK